MQCDPVRRRIYEDHYGNRGERDVDGMEEEEEESGGEGSEW